MGAGRNGRRLGPHPWRLGAIWQARARLEAERAGRGGTPEGACCQDRRIQLGFKPAQGVFLSGPSLRLTGRARAIVAPAAVGVRAWRGLGRAGIPGGVRLGRPVGDVRRVRLARRRLVSTRAVETSVVSAWRRRRASESALGAGSAARASPAGSGLAGPSVMSGGCGSRVGAWRRRGPSYVRRQRLAPATGVAPSWTGASIRYFIRSHDKVRAKGQMPAREVVELRRERAPPAPCRRRRRRSPPRPYRRGRRSPGPTHAFLVGAGAFSDRRRAETRARRTVRAPGSAAGRTPDPGAVGRRRVRSLKTQDRLSARNLEL